MLLGPFGTQVAFQLAPVRPRGGDDAGGFDSFSSESPDARHSRETCPARRRESGNPVAGAAASKEFQKRPTPPNIILRLGHPVP